MTGCELGFWSVPPWWGLMNLLFETGVLILSSLLIFVYSETFFADLKSKFHRSKVEAPPVP